MSLTLQRSDYFNRDFDLQYRWYLDRAGEKIAEGYLQAVTATLRLLAAHPDLGWRRTFVHPMLHDLRSFRLVSPFERHLIFYRHNAIELFAERLMDGGRDLPRRLAQPPGSAEE